MSLTDLNREQRRDAQRALGGFKPERTIYRLKFEDPGYKGLVVEMAGIKVGVFLEVAELGDLQERRFTKADMPKVRRLFEIAGEGLVDWNVIGEDDEPVPATLAGMMTQEFPFVLTILSAWMSAVGDVPGPLGQTSDDGRLSAVASLPMDVASASPAP